ncbi:MAG TPA: class I SAM-dependent methyltransferase [Gaiellaceae bacterium]|jgi:ubiquinone/menaquinone biosynthesis C-methylase UbiE|nr:class I SAM-dependent methyltransferase [Gaiellaceae bacterium]
MNGRTIHQHPLAYLLGLQGIALLRAFSGGYEDEFTRDRLREIRALLDAADELGDSVDATPMTARDGYAIWAERYDEPGNALIDMEQPRVRAIVDGLPVGVALDAACGTGRHAAYLASLGHTVIGADESPEMLAVARRKLPQVAFHEAGLYDLPLPGDSVDLVVCALALSHVPDLERALAELVRVLRPGGHLVLSDSRGLIGDIGLPHVRIRPDGSFGYMPVWNRLVSDFLAAALPLDLELRRCDEVRQDEPIVGDDELPSEHVPGRPPSIWALHPFCPAAANAAWLGKPRALVLHFRLQSSSSSSPTRTAPGRSTKP